MHIDAYVVLILFGNFIHCGGLRQPVVSEY